MELKRTLIQTETFAYGDYRVDLVILGNEMEAWLYHKNNGVKSLMWGTKRKYYNKSLNRTITVTPDTFLEMIEDGLEDYIKGYKEMYEDE